MKRPNLTQRLLLAAAATAVAVGCASTTLDEKPAPVAEKSAPAPAAAPAPAPAPDTRTVARVDTAPKTIDPLSDPNSALAKRSVFFDFDRFEVRSEFQPLVEAHGRYLATTKSRRIVIEGNADERGSREYNLALGQKRADAVRSRLTLLGATDTQIETISYGEERPRAAGHDESSWAQNRRADIVYK
jgi:peptidoglycan-associated lipoprotein